MRKTSVYLPDHLKRALAAHAAATGRSEADVVRAAVAAEVEPVDRAARPGPAVDDPPRPGRLVGVGVGPGDPDLLTMRAARALRRADRVVAPSTAPDAVGRAETILREALPDVRVERAPFPMVTGTGARTAAIDDIAAQVTAHLEEGREVAFITLGDPLTYSTFSSLADAVGRQRPGTTVEVVPGIMAFQSLAARTDTTLVDERQRLSIRTALGDPDELAGDLNDPTCTTVLYKGGRHLPRLAEAARHAGRADSAVAGELLGMAGERVGLLDDLAGGPASYLATVILPATGHTADRPVDPPSRTLVVGVGASSGVGAAEVRDLVHGALAGAGLRPEAVGLVATVDLKATEPGIVALAEDLGAELRTFAADDLAGVDVPRPSERVAAGVGAPSVAEAAALLAAGGDLVVAKQSSAAATVAIARRA